MIPRVIILQSWIAEEHSKLDSLDAARGEVMDAGMSPTRSQMLDVLAPVMQVHQERLRILNGLMDEALRQ